MAAGIKQWQLASSLGISQAELSNYEIGRRRVPVTVRYRIAKILDKKVEELFPEYEERNRDEVMLRDRGRFNEGK